MKIAFAMINVNRRDGSARAVIEVAERLALKHEVHLFARKVEDADLSNITWHKMPGLAWPEVADFLSYRWRTRSLLKREDFDIIHSIGPNAIEANVITIQNIQPAKKKILERLSKDEAVSPLRRLTRGLYLSRTSAAEKHTYTQSAYGKKQRFLPVSKGVAKELQTHYHIPDNQIEIIPNAADLKKFHPISEAEKHEWRSANELSPEDLIAIFVGGEWARKGLDFAIKGLAGMQNKQLKLYVAGTDPDEARFKQMARDHSIVDRVIFGGFRQDISTAMAASDLFLFPSWYEAFSLASIEAAACGLPIIATKINGTEDFISPGVTGDFIEHDPEQIAFKLDQLVAEPKHLTEMGCKAHALVKENYTWDKITAMTEAAYQGLVN